MYMAYTHKGRKENAYGWVGQPSLLKRLSAFHAFLTMARVRGKLRVLV